MAVDNASQIDAIANDKENACLVLLITDHLNWDNEFEHLKILQDKGPQSQAPAAHPQSPAVRGFQRFQDRSRFARLNRKTAVKGEQDTPLVPITADFSR